MSLEYYYRLVNSGIGKKVKEVLNGLIPRTDSGAGSGKSTGETAGEKKQGFPEWKISE